MAKKKKKRKSVYIQTLSRLVHEEGGKSSVKMGDAMQLAAMLGRELLVNPAFHVAFFGVAARKLIRRRK